MKTTHSHKKMLPNKVKSRSEIEAATQEEMRSRELPAEYEEAAPLPPRVSVREVAVHEAEIEKRLALYSTGADAGNTDPQYDLYILPADPVCRHLKLYMDLTDLNDMFRITDVNTIPTPDRPSWLQGVPSIAVPCDQKDELRLLVGDEALEFVRELSDGPDAANRTEDLEVVGARDQSSLTTNTDDLGHGRAGKVRPEDDQELLHFLLPLPRYMTDTAGVTDAKMDPDAVKQMMVARSTMFE